MRRCSILSKPKMFLSLAAIICLLQIQNTNAESTTDVEGRTSTVQLSGSNSNTYLYSALLIVPVLAIIVLLDFAIFGTFARREDELNPVSNFFYHVRRGLHISNEKYRRRYGFDTNRYNRYGRPGHRNRYTRFASMLFSEKWRTCSSSITKFWEKKLG